MVTHGWPGSVIEQIRIIEPLTDPTAHGEPPKTPLASWFPSMPGYGFSGKPAKPGWERRAPPEPLGIHTNLPRSLGI